MCMLAWLALTGKFTMTQADWVRSERKKHSALSSRYKKLKSAEEVISSVVLPRAFNAENGGIQVGLQRSCPGSIAWYEAAP